MSTRTIWEPYGINPRTFTDEYKASPVGIVFNDGRTLADAAGGIGDHEMTLSRWVKKLKDASKVHDSALDYGERGELELRRADNERL